MIDPAMTYIDYQQMEDGSRRWLWKIIHHGRLWRAGVEHQYDQAKDRAIRAYDALRRAVSQEERDCLRSTEEMLEATDSVDSMSPPGPPNPAA